MNSIYFIENFHIYIFFIFIFLFHFLPRKCLRVWIKNLFSVENLMLSSNWILIRAQSSLFARGKIVFCLVLCQGRFGRVVTSLNSWLKHFHWLETLSGSNPVRQTGVTVGGILTSYTPRAWRVTTSAIALLRQNYCFDLECASSNPTRRIFFEISSDDSCIEIRDSQGWECNAPILSLVIPKCG